MPISPSKLARLARQWPRPPAPPLPAFQPGDGVVLPDGRPGRVWRCSGDRVLVVSPGSLGQRFEFQGEEGGPAVGGQGIGTEARWLRAEELLAGLRLDAEVTEPRQPLEAVAAPPAPTPPKPSRPPMKPGSSRNRSRPPAVW